MVVRVKAAEPFQVMLLNGPARFLGAWKSVTGEKFMLTDGRVIWTCPSPLRNCRRRAFTLRLAKSSRWLNAMSESMVWVWSLGSKLRFW